MRSNRGRLLVACLWLAVAGCLGVVRLCQAASAEVPPAATREVEKQTFALINTYRERENLPDLKWNDGIAQLARDHSRDMASGAVSFGHGGFGERVDGMKALIAGFRGAGENVAFLDRLADAPRRAVDLWLHSPHHLKNIRGDYTLSGIGVWQAGDGTLYFTQLFLKTAEPGNE